MRRVNGCRMGSVSRGFTASSLVVLALLVGCTGRPQGAYSGFLRDYSQLKPHPKIEGAMLYENPSRSLKQYSKFVIDPVIVHFAPEAGGTAMAPDDLKELTDYFRNQSLEWRRHAT